MVEVTEKHIDAFARIDNRGTAARGPIQYLASATLNNVLGQHEALTLSWASVQPVQEPAVLLLILSAGVDGGKD